MENSWKRLPGRSDPWSGDSGPVEHVLAEDRPYVQAFNRVVGSKSRRRLRTDLLPESFTGPRDAPVVVLFLNPGVGGEEG